MIESLYMKEKRDWFAKKECNLFGAINHKDFQNIISVESVSSMPCWYYDKKKLRETPSIMEGLALETERRYRKEGARFILECGTKMGLGINTIATGVVYFHRFYMMHSFKSFPRYVTACCCLFLAGKVEETPKKCRDIIRNARSLLSDDHYYSFGDDPKEEVMTLERILLQTIKFDLQVQHPHTYLLKYAKCFKGDQTKLQRMVQMAWNFVNDSMSTVVCLQWEPEIIAVALIHLASKLSKFTVLDWIGKQPHHNRWWDTFVADVTMEILEDICHQVLDLYQTNQKEAEPKSPPQKPPSRADSPTTVRPLPLASNTSSPTGKTTKTSTAASSATTNATTDTSTGHPIKTLTSVPPVTVVTTASTDATPVTVAPLAIPSGAPNTFHHLFHAPPPLNPHHMHANLYTTSSAAPTATAAGGAAPPPPPHPPGVAFPGTTAVPPLPPPPPVGIPPYTGPPPPNAWTPLPTHYSNLPPPIPPHTGPPPLAHSGGSSGSSTTSGNYYNSSSSSSSSSSYSRQSRY